MCLKANLQGEGDKEGNKGLVLVGQSLKHENRVSSVPSLGTKENSSGLYSCLATEGKLWISIQNEKF